MKAAFYIPIQRQPGKPLKLLVEAGNQTISFLWYHCEPKVLAGLSVYHLNQPLQAGLWKKLVQAESHLLEPTDQVIICYDVKDSTLVPASYYLPETAADILHELYGQESRTEIHQTYIEVLAAYLLYRLPAGLHEEVIRSYPGALVTHSTREQVMQGVEKSVDLQAIFYTQTIKVCMYRAGALLFTQYMSYQTASDACYHLLNACHRQACKPEDLRVRLSGMIEKGSPLFTEIYSCFPDIELTGVGPEWELPEAAAEFPGHYFSHLTELVSCAS